MGCVTFMFDNYLDSDVVSTATVSSEQTSFPVSNLYDFARRSKVWRTNGNWEITDTNKTLVFRESLGFDISVDLTVGFYASSTLLFAEIKSKMEAAGGSVYTIITATGTNKVKFTSDGGGGAGYFELRWTSSTALAETLGFDELTNDTGVLTYTADLLRIHTDEWLKWDFGISTQPKAFNLIGKRNEPLKISPSATLILQGNETDVWTGNPSYNQAINYNDEVITLLSSTGFHTEALRYWRFKIIDYANSQGYVEAGAIFLGDTYSTTRGAAQFPLQNNHVDRSITVSSEGGQTFSDIKQKTEMFSLRWFGLTYEEKEAFDEMFDTVGTGSPFFVSLDPNEAYSSSKGYYLRYVKFIAPPIFTLVSPNNFSGNMTLREEL